MDTKVHHPTPSCHCADRVHKARMLIGDGSGLSSSIIQQTGLFSIQSVLLLVVMVGLVLWEELFIHTHRNTFSTPKPPHRPQCPEGGPTMNNTSKRLQGQVMHYRERCPPIGSGRAGPESRRENGVPAPSGSRASPCASLTLLSEVAQSLSQ